MTQRNPRIHFLTMEGWALCGHGARPTAPAVKLGTREPGRVTCVSCKKLLRRGVA